MPVSGMKQIYYIRYNTKSRWNIISYRAMIVGMKNYMKFGIVTALSLSLIPGQVSIGAPTADKNANEKGETVLTDVPTASTPLGTAQAILKQVQDAASKLAAASAAAPSAKDSAKENADPNDPAASGSDLIETELSASGLIETELSESETDTMAVAENESEEERRKEEHLLQEERLKHLSDFLHAQQNAMTTPQTDSSFPFFREDLFRPGSLNQLLQEAESGTEDETETETEAETETETEIPEETETEFHPIEMGASIPDTGGALPEETETETETESSSGGSGEDETSQEETQSENPETETPETEVDDSVMVSRHGVFAIPEVKDLNEARINLYDYRMLREYPLSRLPKDLHILYRQMQEQVAEYDGTWSVYVQNLTTGQALVVNDSPMRSASVMKLFIMETVYEAFDRGDLPRNEDTVYLLRSMIINSSNESSNRLLALLGDGDIAVGIARVNEFIRLRGFSSGTIEYNGFEDPNARVDPSHANAIMAKDVGLLLSRVYNRAFISRKVCNEIEQMMLDQQTRYKIPRGLPEGVECGNKSGETDTIANDAAVIYGPTTDYILVVLSNDWSNNDTANAQIAEISKAVYSFFEE